jgi:restriction endonuclease S subunit
MLQYILAVNDIFRLDSFFYAKEFLENENKLQKVQTKTICELNANIKSFGAYSLNNDVEYICSGIPFIRGINMKKGMIDFSDMLYITVAANTLLYKSSVRPETILLSMSGTIGNVAIAQKNWKYPINSNQDIAKINFNSINYNPYLAYIFLLSRYGQDYLRREARGSIQQHVFLSQLENFRMPIFLERFVNVIEQSVLIVHQLLDDAQLFYTEAEQVLLSELGMEGFSPSNKAAVIKSFSESFGESGRLDAEYYQEKYEEYSKIVSAFKGGCTDVSKKFNLVTTSFVKTREQYPYIEIGNINTDNSSYVYNMVATEELPANAKIQVQCGDLLVSKVRPYRGAVSIIRQCTDDLVASGAFTVLRQIDKYPVETLSVLLRTPIYKDWLLKWNVGSAYPVIKDEDIISLPIPLFDDELHAQISEKVQQSFALRNQSEQLLEQAKQAVEMAIEQGEDTAMKWLKSVKNI